MIDVNNIKIETISEGKDLIDEIRTESHDCLEMMRREAAAGNNTMYRKLQDRSYDLHKAKKEVQNQMTKIFKQKRQANGVASN